MAVTDLIFDYIEIRGFMAFSPKKAQKLILNTNKLTTIIGENLDIGDGERNGAGKSSLIDALLYLFFGKSPRVSNQGFLNYVEPGVLFISGSASRNGIAFLVERGENPSVLRLFEKPINETRPWRTKEHGKLIFECTKSTKPETTKRIIELLGFDLKLSDVLLVNNPSDRSCFFLKTEEDQRNIVERIFGFTVFTEKAESLRELRKEENKNLITKESALTATRLANDRVMHEITQLEEKSNTWAAERDKTIKILTHQIQTYKKVDFDHEIKVLGDTDQLLRTLQDLERDLTNHQLSLENTKKRHSAWHSQHIATLATLEEKITRLKEADAAADMVVIKKDEALRAAIKDLITSLATARREAETYHDQHEVEHTTKARLTKQITIIETQVMQLSESKCPTCGQEWSDNQDHILHSVADLDGHNAEVAETDKRIHQFKAAFNEATSTAERLERQLEKTNKELGVLPATTFKTTEEAARAGAELDQEVHELGTETVAVNPHDQAMAELQTTITTVVDKCEKMKVDIANKPKTVYENLTKAVAAQRTAEGLIQQFDQITEAENPYRDTIDNLRSNVLKEIDEVEIKELRNKIEHMNLLIKLLSDKDSPIRTEILYEWTPLLNDLIAQYLGELEIEHRVSFDTNMTASFTLNNKELSFGNLSTGQRLRVWLSANLAFRRVFELINYSVGTFFVDELLDKGMSSRGADVSFNLLERMITDQNNSLFLISHRSEICDRSDHIITLQLENGLSTIVQ